MEAAKRHGITTICIGKPHLNLYKVIMSTAVFNQLLNSLAASDIDVGILS
jgi:two-component system sensor histidine kinase KdpD